MIQAEFSVVVGVDLRGGEPPLERARRRVERAEARLLEGFPGDEDTVREIVGGPGSVLSRWDDLGWLCPYGGIGLRAWKKRCREWRDAMNALRGEEERALWGWVL